MGRNFGPVVVLFLHFLVFQLWHFDFSLIKAPLAFCSLYIWNFRLDSPQINISKEPSGRFGLILHFGPYCKNISDILMTPLRSQAAERREMMPLKMQPVKRWCFSSQLVIPKRNRMILCYVRRAL